MSENVQEAIQLVRPFGIDVCSGIRTERNLDEKKLAIFFEKIEHTHSIDLSEHIS